MIQQFGRSGLTGAAFSRRYGIPLSTLKWWLKKERRASKLPTPMIFQELRPQLPEKPPGNAWAMEISAPSGWTIRCREAMSAEDLARLMRRGRC
jgi:hypothetical protein